MKNFQIIGINHKTAPITVREKYFLSTTEQLLLLSELKSDPSVVEAFVLSTCNRTEVYFHQIKNAGISESIAWKISQIKNQKNSEEFLKHAYQFVAIEAVEHLFRVACGLDSLVLGEKQILGQVKDSFERSRKLGILGRELNILSNTALRAGKKSQTETQISFGGSSISWAAVSLAERELGTLKAKSILIIGAGKMSELAVGQIANKGFLKLYLMNRTAEHAQDLAAKYQGVAVPFCDIKEILSEVDLCICSAGAPYYILDFYTTRRVMEMRKNRKLVLMDISMPRNIDPKTAHIKHVRLFHIDHLQSVVEDNLQRRKKAAEEVEVIIKNKLAQFYKKTDNVPAPEISKSNF